MTTSLLTGPAAVDLREVRKTFGTSDRTVVAVDGLDLRIDPGEVVAVLGPNGAGKTTTLDMVLGLTSPSSGTVRTFGQDPRASVAAGRVSAVLQSGGLLDDLTVGETVRLVASLYGSREIASRAHVGQVMDRAGITHLARRRVSKCSGGEQQRLRFALALLPEPDLLVLDEPTAGMDVSARQEFWAAMHADADGGRTVVFATHYLHEAEEFARRVVLVDGGRVVADGTTAELRARSSARTVSADLAPDTETDARATLHALSGVQAVQVSGVEPTGQRITVRCTDSDAVARALLHLGAHDLEIARASLDQTFLDLTHRATDATARDTTTDITPEMEPTR
ncbi:ABC transporter ATP-binding protein [Mobilicoccus pelagius]|uniref:Putative ABC transporter ATP-binding protein n=1 Tax=Mobilicoccus pelagius NBRC 104925 TaxID=1089455 RepID=H5UNK5_9MICO|nr:ABC transporter ATP-binding protein [Mobilicoccus pelagius]GAB47313.1 putative ABC transporter ATP-binding protein [Mobilicoccus pelagius NBRC 104925]